MLTRARVREYHDHEKKVGGYRYFFFMCLWALVFFTWFLILR